MSSLRSAFISAVLGALLLMMPGLWPMKPASPLNETIIYKVASND